MLFIAKQGKENKNWILEISKMTIKHIANIKGETHKVEKRKAIKK